MQIQAIHGTYNHGQLSLEQEAPKGKSKVIVLFTEEHPADESRKTASQQKAAIERFYEAIKNSPPLPPEFDEIMSKRVTIDRVLDL